MKGVMHGDSLRFFIMSFAGYHLNAPGKPGYKSDEPDWQVLYHGKQNTNNFTETDDDFYDDRSWWMKRLGLYWVGWPWEAKVYVYPFEWNEAITDKSGNATILIRAEATDHVYAADFTYGIRTEEAKTHSPENLPIEALTFLTVAIRNPYRALFSGEDWLWRVTAAVNRHARSFIGAKNYNKLVTPSKDVTTAIKSVEFSQPIIKLNEKLFDDSTEESKPPYGLFGRYGVEIRTADLQWFRLAGSSKKELDEAATKEYVAGRNAKAITIEARARATALKSRLNVIKAAGNEGMLLAQLDAMQESSKGASNTVVWANNPFIPFSKMPKSSD